MKHAGINERMSWVISSNRAYLKNVRALHSEMLRGEQQPQVVGDAG
jgi:hypothetical protein